MKPQPRFDWRHQYDMLRDKEEGDAATVYNTDEPITQQQFKDDADINILAKRYGLEKQPLPVEALDPRFYGDLSEVPDLRTLLDIANEAKNHFMELPPKLRARFNNQPGQLWAFVNDPENADESVRLGLLVRPPDPPQVSPQEDTKDTPIQGVT